MIVVGSPPGAQQAAGQPGEPADTHLLGDVGVDHWWLVRACRAQVAEQGRLRLWGARISVTVPWHRTINHD